MMNRYSKCFFSVLTCLFLATSGCSSGDKPVDTKQSHADGGVTNASVSSDGRFSIVAGVKHPAGLWSLSQNKRLFTWKNSKSDDAGIIATAFSPDGKYAATAEKKNIALWDTASGNVISYWLVKREIQTIAVSSDGHYILLGFANGIAEYVEMVNGMSVRSFDHTAPINTVALSRDGRYALTGSDDKTAALWDIQTGKKLQSWKHENRVTQVAISPNNKLVFTSESQGKAYLWNLRDGSLRQSLGLSKASISAVRFSQSGKYLAFATMPHQLQLWDAANAKKLQTWRLPKPSQWRPSSIVIHAVGFSADEKTIITEDSSGFGRKWQID